MENVSQFIYGNDVTLPLDSVKTGQLYFCDSGDKINVYRKTKKGNVLIKSVDTYYEVSQIEGINIEP
jgi:hypothetical protein